MSGGGLVARRLPGFALPKSHPLAGLEAFQCVTCDGIFYPDDSPPRACPYCDPGSDPDATPPTEGSQGFDTLVPNKEAPAGIPPAGACSDGGPGTHSGPLPFHGVTVAALYVEKNGVYWDLDGVDPWDEERDARLYAGPWPVVAHPPCQRWCQLAPVVAKKLAYLSDKYAIGNDGGTFEAALAAVRRWGGVLEHPAYSLAWSRYGLPVPGHGGWTTSLDDPGYSTAVSQVAYGHECRKRTWLYAVGCELPALDWSEPLHLVTGQVSSFELRRRSFVERNLNRLDKNQSDGSPVAFRDVLLGMARTARIEAAA